MEALEVGYKVASFWELPQMQGPSAENNGQRVRRAKGARGRVRLLGGV